MNNSTILIIVIIIVCILIGIFSCACHYIGDYGRVFDESAAPVLHPRALGGKSCSCHEEFQGTCEDCKFVTHNGHGLKPQVGDGDKGFGGEDPQNDPFRAMLGNTTNQQPQSGSAPVESIPLTTVTDYIV